MSDLEKATDENGGLELPAIAQLNRNYPNPFTSEMTISFVLAAASHVAFTVFDLTGRRVSTLADRSFRSGEHQLKWNAAGQASGLYFYSLRTADGETRTQSMTLVK